MLDGRFNFGGIKNPIYDHLGAGAPGKNQYQHANQNGAQFAVVGQSQNKQGSAGVTLLGQGIRQQARGQSTGAPYHPGVGSSFMSNTFQQGAQYGNGVRKLDKLRQAEPQPP